MAAPDYRHQMTRLSPDHVAQELQRDLPALWALRLRDLRRRLIYKLNQFIVAVVHLDSFLETNAGNSE